MWTVGLKADSGRQTASIPGSEEGSISRFLPIHRFLGPLLILSSIISMMPHCFLGLSRLNRLGKRGLPLSINADLMALADSLNQGGTADAEGMPNLYSIVFDVQNFSLDSKF